MQGGGKSGRTLFLVIVGVTIFLLAIFLILRPRGSEAGPPQKTTQQ